MFKLRKLEAGHSLIKLLILSALTSIFLSALGSFATAINLANKSLTNRKHSTAIRQTIDNFHRMDEIEDCKTSELLENLETIRCKSKDNIDFSSIREKHNEK